jgi:hypothetical protein
MSLCKHTNPLTGLDREGNFHAEEYYFNDKETREEQIERQLSYNGLMALMLTGLRNSS